MTTTRGTSAGAGARDQVARLLTLVPFLHHRGQVRLADAARLLDTTPDQVLGDLKVLFMCGLPGGLPDDLIDVDLDAIESEQGSPRGDGLIRVSNADYLARPLRLTPTEASAVIVALRTLREASPPDTQRIVDGVIAKLEAAAASAAADRQVAVTTGPREAELAVLAARLQEAADRGRQVRLAYFVPARDEVSERVVDPRGVVASGRFQYLDAWCHSAGAPRLFRLDRVAEATVLDSPVTTERTPPRDLSAGPFQGEHGTVVTLCLEPQARWMTEYYLVQDLREVDDDGRVEVDLVVADPRWLTRLMMRLAPYAAVVGPQEFTESFTATAQQTLALYR